MITFHLLRAFETLAHSERYADAAEQLGISQATLSAQIATLERILGLQLFEQLGGRTRSTSAAHELLGSAREMVRLVDEARLAMAERAGAETIGALPVRISADTTVGTYVLPELLGELRRSHPAVHVVLDIANRARVCARLAAGETDLAVLGQPPDLPDTIVEPYLSHDLVAFAAASHPLVAERAVPLARFAAEPLIVREPGSGTRRTVEALLSAAGLKPHIALELGHNGAIKAAVTAGLGVAVMSKVTLDRELALGRVALLAVEGFPIPRRWHIVRQRQRRLSVAASIVLATMLAQRDR